MDLLLHNALAAEEREPTELPRLRMLIESILTSDFWKRAMRSPRRLVEVPFCIKASGSELERADERPVLLSGVIDLAFLEPVREDLRSTRSASRLAWVIADYKTDEIVDDLQKYVSFYAPQVRLYSRYWAEITGQPVKETGLFFTYLNRWVPVG